MTTLTKTSLSGRSTLAGGPVGRLQSLFPTGYLYFYPNDYHIRYPSYQSPPLDRDLFIR